MIAAFAVSILVQTPTLQYSWELLTKPAVEDELHLDAVTRAAIASALKRADDDLTAARHGQPFMAQMDYRVLVYSKAAPRIREIGLALSPSQKARLLELSLRSSDDYVFEANPGIQTLLHITKDQMLQIAADRDRMKRLWNQKIHDYAIKHNLAMAGQKGHPNKAGNGWYPVRTPDIRKMEQREKDETWAAIRRDLSKTQNECLNRLLGKPFKFY